MKIVLVVLIFCFFINFISAFSWFSYRTNHQPKQITDSTTTRRPISHLQRSTFQHQNQLRNGTNSLPQAIVSSSKTNANYSPRQRIVNWQQYQLRNTTAVQRQADSINKKSSQIIPQNRFQAIAYQQQQQQRSFNNPLASRQANRVITNPNNQAIHSRLRSFPLTGKNNPTVGTSVSRRVFPSATITKAVLGDSKPKSSLNIKNNIQSFQPRSALAKAIVRNTKLTLLQTLTTKAINNNVRQDRQRLLDDFYYQQRLKTFYQRMDEQTAARTQSNMKAGLRRRKRQNEQKLIQADNYPMILARDDLINKID